MKSVAGVLLLAALCVPAVAQQSPSQISLADAKKLVMAALPSETKQLPKFELLHWVEKGDPLNSQFYFFTGVWNNPNPGSVVTGNYAVDKETGNVWNAPSACDELTNPGVRKLQTEIRTRIGLSDAAYRKKKPTCPLETQSK